MTKKPAPKPKPKPDPKYDFQIGPIARKPGSLLKVKK